MGRITKTHKVNAFWSILYFSWCVTTVADLNKVLDENQVRYLSKLGDYVRILMRIPWFLKTDKAKIIVEQVRPPAAKSIEVHSGPLEVLNLRCRHIASDEIESIENWGLATDAYENAQPGAVGKKNITLSQHCEITLALDMLERQSKFAKQKIKIGMSKACCEWCYEYLNLLASVYPEHPILVRASQGKKPDGWMMPPKSLKSIAKQMRQLIERRLDNVIWNIDNRRRSDSNEWPNFAKEEADLEAFGYLAKNIVDFDNIEV